MNATPTEQDVAEMPISKENLKALFEHLNRPISDPCRHNLTYTEEFLDERNLDKTKILPWLNKYCAWCDCEVIFNVHETWGEIVGLEFVDEDAEVETDHRPWWKFW